MPAHTIFSFSLIEVLLLSKRALAYSFKLLLSSPTSVLTWLFDLQALPSLVGNAAQRDIFKNYVTSPSQRNYASLCVKGLRHRVRHRGMMRG